MEFYDPIVAQEELPKTEGINDNKTEEAVHKLEDEIDQAYTAVETRFAGLWSSASKNANELQEKYKLEEHKNQLLEQLSSAKTNINNKAKVTENLGQIEEQLKALSGHIPDVDLKNLQQHASSTLDTLDSTLEQVEKQAGKYVTQLTSFFSGMVSVNPGLQQQDESSETLFKTPLATKENYGTSRYDNDLYNLHTTASIYTSDESDNKEEVKKFNADAKTNEISKLLKEYPNTLTKLMNDLVPVKISYELFWYRYFKAEEKLKESEQKRKELLKKKETKDANENEDDGEEFNWDDDDEEEDVVDVAKETQDNQDTNPAKVANSAQISSKNKADDANDDDDDDDDWE
mmetsp:Transcript_8342/g.8269  ORF Transcript_8342/g.8269 Transcript_8342/m.8269 type:complete len:346 (-) Transcript_8342:55-1092(-)